MLYRRHYDHLPCGIVVTAPDSGRVEYANADGAAILAATPAELAGQSVYDLRPDHAAEWHALAVSAMRAGHRRELITLDGRWYVSHASPTECGLVLCASRDVTDAVQFRAQALLTGARCGAPRTVRSDSTLIALALAGHGVDDIANALGIGPDIVAASLFDVAGVPLR